jgi:hypothetical protein
MLYDYTPGFCCCGSSSSSSSLTNCVNMPFDPLLATVTVATGFFATWAGASAVLNFHGLYNGTCPEWRGASAVFGNQRMVWCARCSSADCGPFPGDLGTMNANWMIQFVAGNPNPPLDCVVTVDNIQIGSDSQALPFPPVFLEFDASLNPFNRLESVITS